MSMIETPAISPEHKNFATQLINELPKVTIHEQLPPLADDGSTVTTREALAAHVRSTVRRYREDNVVYLELRVVVEDFCDTDFTLADAFATALDAVAVEGIQARLLAAVRADGEDVAELVDLALAAQGDPNLAGVSFILGDGQAGQEQELATQSGQHSSAPAALPAIRGRWPHRYRCYWHRGSVGCVAFGTTTRIGR